MTYLITVGGSSYLGKNLASAYENLGVTNLSFRPGFEGDFEEQLVEYLKCKPKAVVIAGASQVTGVSAEEAMALYLSNIRMPSKVCDAILDHSPETILIAIGSSWEYNARGQLDPFNLYASSKTFMRSHLEMRREEGLRAKSLILYDTFGPQDPRNKVINLITDSLIKKTEISLTGGEQSLDLIHISDCVRAVTTVIEDFETLRPGPLEVRSGKPRMLKDYITELCATADLDESLCKFGQRPYRENERFNLMPMVPWGWQPEIEFSKAIPDFVSDRREFIADTSRN